MIADIRATDPHQMFSEGQELIARQQLAHGASARIARRHSPRMVRAMVDNLVRARVLDMMARRMPHLRWRALGKLKAGRILEFRAWLAAHKDLVGPDRADLRRTRNDQHGAHQYSGWHITSHHYMRACMSVRARV